jgi:hypothetical protein
LAKLYPSSDERTNNEKQRRDDSTLYETRDTRHDPAPQNQNLTH